MVRLRILEACKIGDISKVQSDTAVHPDLTDINGAGCLHYAARGGSLEIMKYLIKSAGFSPLQRSNTGSTALHDAAARGNTAIVKWLVEECALNVDDQDGVGITALHLAARYCHPLTVEWLLDEACADESIRTGSGAIPLFFAVVGGDLNCVKILMDENPRLVNMQLNNGATPLYIACQNGLLDIAQYLHSRNGATKINAYDGMTCLHAAAQLGFLELVKWLVQVGECNPNDRDFDGATPLHYAASRGHSEVVRWLLAHGSARVTLDNLGGSPLHSAAEMGELQAVGALLDSGCDVTLVDNQGLTAAELADKCDQPEAAALIRGEVTLDQLSLEEDYLSSQELPTQRPTQLQSPRFNFPPPPPFPPEEEEQEPEEKHFYDSVAATKYQRDQSQPTAPVQSLDSPSSYTPPPPLPLALHDSPVRGRDLTPPPPPPPLPLALHDSLVRGRDLTPPSPPPTPPAQATYAPPLSASDSALVWDPREVQPEQEEVFHRRVADSQLEATFSGYSGTEGQGQPIVRRTTSRLSVNSSTSDLGAFEVATVVADVHKSRESIDSVNAVQAAPTSNSVTSAIYINSVALSNSTSKEPFQHRKFSVLKHIPQNTGIQEKPELENSNNNVATAINNNKSSYHSINKHNTEEFSSAVWPVSRHQRSPSPPLPSPPPLSPGSESINSEDASISASTSCSNLQPQEADLPPPLPQLHLLSQSRGTSIENFPPPPSEFIQAQSSSLYEELPPPPPPPPPSQLNTNSEWQSASSNQDFPDPPSPARLAIASRQKLNYSSSKDYTGSTSSERASSTSNFKQYFDSGTRANFARVKALFGAVSETNSEPNKFRLGSEGQSKVSKKGRESPAGRQPRRCVNPDSGESETDCGNIQQIGLKAGVGNKRNLKEVSSQPKLLMNPATQSDSSGPLSPALSTQSGHSIESSVNQDSVQSSVSNRGGHVTAISTSGGKNGEKAANGAATALRQDKTEGTPAGASTNTDVVKEESTTKAPVPPTDSSSSSNGVVMRGGSAGPGRALARMVVSAGPEMLARPNSLNGQSQSSSSSSQPPSPAVKKNKHDLIADIQSAVSGTSNLSLRRAKSRGEGVSMVYSSKRNSTGQDQSKMTDTTRPLTGDFDPKNFLDQVETVDTTGRTIPEWRRHVLAKHAAEKAQKEFEERRVEEDYESRFKDMPAWKRALIERREAQAREEEAASKK